MAVDVYFEAQSLVHQGLFLSTATYGEMIGERGSKHVYFRATPSGTMIREHSSVKHGISTTIREHSFRHYGSLT